jgi:hypothetical protein
VLLEKLGIRTIHWPGRDRKVSLTEKVAGHETDLDFVLQTILPVLNRHDGAADVPIPVLFRQLQDQFPGSRWILTLRDPADWVRSVRKHIGNRELSPFERVQYWQYFPDRPARVSDVSDAELIRMYAQHTEQVTEFSRSLGTGKLGVFDLYDDRCGADIATFLGRRRQLVMPHIDTPLEIRSATRWARVSALFRRALRAAD